MKARTLTLSMLIVAIILFTASCHKGQTTATTPQKTTAAPPFFGLSGIRHHEYISGANLAGNIDWLFYGTPDTTIMPPADTASFGSMKLYYTGNNVARIVQSGHSSFNNYFQPTSVYISYNVASQPDTVTFVDDNSGIPANAFVFTYNGNHIASIIYAYGNYIGDTIHWSTADINEVIYTGSNISQIVTIQYNSPPLAGDTAAIFYFSDGRANNMAGSIPAYIIQYFILNGATTNTSKFIQYLPVYTNSNIVTSVVSPFQKFSFTTATDLQGRIVKRIINFNITSSFSSLDTMLYQYSE